MVYPGQMHLSRGSVEPAVATSQRRYGAIEERMSREMVEFYLVAITSNCNSDKSDLP
jgi:hypothetical protein